MNIKKTADELIDKYLKRLEKFVGGEDRHAQSFAIDLAILEAQSLYDMVALGGHDNKYDIYDTNGGPIKTVKSKKRKLTELHKLLAELSNRTIKTN